MTPGIQRDRRRRSLRSTCANGATRRAPRSSSSTAGRSASGAGTARLEGRLADEFPTGHLRHSRAWHVREAARPRVLRRRAAVGGRPLRGDRAAPGSSGRWSSPGPTAASSSPTTCAAYGEAPSAASRSWAAPSVLKPPTFEHFGPGLLENAQATLPARPRAPTSPRSAGSFGRARSSARRPRLGNRRCAGTWSCRREIRGALIAREIDADDVLAAPVGAGARDPRARGRDRAAVDGPSTSWSAATARPPPGTRASATCRSWRTRSASTRTWRGSSGGHTPAPL